MTYDDYRAVEARNAEQRRIEALSKGRDGKRPRHSHRCVQCGSGVYCYKGQCTKPQKVLGCGYC